MSIKLRISIIFFNFVIKPHQNNEISSRKRFRLLI